MLLWVFAQACHAQVTGGEPRVILADLETIEALSYADQAREIPRIYRETWPGLQIALVSSFVIQPNVARSRCRALLESHHDQLVALVREDLRSGDVIRGLRAAGEFRLASLYDDVSAHLQGRAEVYAAYALAEINDPRAIALLTGKGVLMHFEPLRRLQRNRPAVPSLAELLDSPDSGIRWRTAYALAESADPKLIPSIRKLARDPSPQVRAQAANMAFSLAPDIFATIRPVLVAMLADQSLDVKSTVAIFFAARNDGISTKAIYELLSQEDQLEPWRQSNIVQAMNTLTGSYFGFTPGTISTPSARRENLQRLAKWMQQNPATQHRILQRRNETLCSYYHHRYSRSSQNPDHLTDDRPRLIATSMSANLFSPAGRATGDHR